MSYGLAARRSTGTLRVVARRRSLDDVLPANVITRCSSRLLIQEELPSANLVIGAVLVTGVKSPRLVTRADLALLPPGAVSVDVAVGRRAVEPQAVRA